MLPGSFARESGVLEPNEVRPAAPLRDGLNHEVGRDVAQGRAVGGRVQEEVREVGAQGAVDGQARQ
eukprot:4299994-Alexandrium_andersonii.AAC.1